VVNLTLKPLYSPKEALVFIGQEVGIPAGSLNMTEVPEKSNS
jgi:hypothetical protein